MKQELDLPVALAASGRQLLASLCRDPRREWLPYWHCAVSPQYRGRWVMAWPAHNLGRCIDALLRLDAAADVDFVLPPEAGNGLVGHFKQFLGNDEGLCINPDPADWFELHSLRETLLALCALARWRPLHEEWATGATHRLLEAIDRMLTAEGTWDLGKSAEAGKRTIIHRHHDPVGSHGRLLEALAEALVVLPSSAAETLARRLGAFAFERCTSPDGSINWSTKPDHTHSYLNTLKGLLRLGKLLGERAWVDRVALTAETTVRRLVLPSGFVSHDLGADHGPEPASTADACQLLLWLARDGLLDGADDCERWIRARLLPSIIADSPEIAPEAEGSVLADDTTDLRARLLGAFGGCHTEPHGGKQAVTDVSAACAHSLLDLHASAVCGSAGDRSLLLHVSGDHPGVAVTSSRTGSRSTVVARMKEEGRLRLRVPAWAPAASLKLEVNGLPTEATASGGFVSLPGLRPGDEARLSFDLPTKTTTERAAGTDFEIHWRGDEVTGIAPNTSFYPFYPGAPAKL